VDWINPTGAKKVHSLIDKVYKRKNLEIAWEKVKENRGSGGVDGQTLEAFEAQLHPAAHVRTLFHRLDRWIVRRLRSHRFKRWRNNRERQLPESLLYAEYGLVNLVRLIPSLASRQL